MYLRSAVFPLLLILFLPGCARNDAPAPSVTEYWQTHHDAPARPTTTQPAEHDSVLVAHESPGPTSGPGADAISSGDGRESVPSQHAPQASTATIAAETPAPSGPAPARAAPDKNRTPFEAPSRGIVSSDGLRVNDESIPVSEILEPLAARMAEIPRDLPEGLYFREIADLIRPQIVEVVAQHLIWSRAKRQLTPELEPNVDKAIDKMEKDRINREFDGRETEYERYLARNKTNREQVRERLKRVLVIDSYLRDRLLPQIPQPRKDELLQYYHSHPDEFTQPERREMFLIDIPIAAFLDLSRPVRKADEDAAYKKAQASIQKAEQALAAGRPFEQVCRDYSQGLRKSEGGCWGFITRPAPGQPAALQGHWEMPSRRLFELEAGQTSEAFEAARSFFIVRVGRIEGGTTKSFQDAQPEIVDKLQQERFIRLRREFLKQQLEDSTIGSLEEFVTAVIREVPGPSSEVRETEDTTAPASRSRPKKAKDAKPSFAGATP